MIHILSDKFDLELPKKVYLIGSGKSINQTHQRIPENDYKIYLNGAVTLKHAKPDLWFAHCQNNLKHDWWKPAYKQNYNISMFGDFITSRGYVSKYFFNFHTDLPRLGVVTGTTVAGIAMQLFPHLGVEEIVLAGIDLSDSYRFDGSYNPKNSDDKWTNIVETLDKVIDSTATCSYSSLGETRLNIECI